MSIKNTGRILFLHGLEAGLNGNKSKYLRKEFINCYTPDFQVSKFKFWLKNSIVRNIFTSPIFLIFFFSIVMASIIISIITEIILPGLLFGLITFIIFILFAKKTLIRNAVKKSLENNIKTAENEINKNNPQVLIGSSWGGAILINLIERRIWKGNTILIAPAYYSVNKVISNNTNAIYKVKLRNIVNENFKGKIIVYHSKEDEVIPIEDSIILCDKDYFNNENNNVNVDIDLKIYEKGDHSMEELLSEPEDILKNDILKLLEHCNSNELPYENLENE